MWNPWPRGSYCPRWQFLRSSTRFFLIVAEPWWEQGLIASLWHPPKPYCTRPKNTEKWAFASTAKVKLQVTLFFLSTIPNQSTLKMFFPSGNFNTWFSPLLDFPRRWILQQILIFMHCGFIILVFSCTQFHLLVLSCRITLILSDAHFQLHSFSAALVPRWCTIFWVASSN